MSARLWHLFSSLPLVVQAWLVLVALAAYLGLAILVGRLLARRGGAS